jgi:regulatory protein
LQKKINEKLISKCWNEIDDADYENEMEKQYQTYYSKLSGLKEYQKKMKTIKYLLSRGFEYELLMNLK